MARAKARARARAGKTESEQTRQSGVPAALRLMFNVDDIDFESMIVIN